MEISVKICVLISIFITLFAFSPSVLADSGDGYIEILDDVGRKVRVKKYPERIVSLAPSNTEILFALGLGSKTVGVTSYCNFPPEAKRKKKVGGFANPDIEKIIALSPDLLLADSMCYKQGIVHKLERNNVRIIVLAPKTLTEVIRTIQMVGKATGREKVSARLTADMEERVLAVTNTTSKIERARKPRVLYISWHDPLWVAGSAILANDLIEKAGGVNIAGDIEGWRIISLEKVLARNPDVVIVSSGHGKAMDLSTKWAEAEPRLKEIDARKYNRVYAIDTDLVARFGPRIVDALEHFAGFIHPELFH
jgi:iron complex transport system substrate-binding protein